MPLARGFNIGKLSPAQGDRAPAEPTLVRGGAGQGGATHLAQGGFGMPLRAMHPHTRALIAASAHAVILKKKVAGLYDHVAARHLRIAAECREGRVQGLDGDRSARFGGVLPELYDHGDKAFVSLDVDGPTVRGYDRGSGSAYVAQVSDRLVQLYDHGENAWFAFDVRVA